MPVTERKLLKHVTSRLLAEDAAWSIICGKNSWLCPYCGCIGVEELRLDDALEARIVTHLISGCERFADLNTPVLARDALERCAALLNVRRRVQKRLQRDSRWQVVDGAGRWICPYCADPAALASPPSVPQLDAVVEHLLVCTAYDAGRGRSQELEELLERRANVEREQVVEHLAGKLRDQAVWRFRTMDKNWLCPFCAEGTDVAFPRHGPVPGAVCDQVLAHLEGCSGYARLAGVPRSERYLKDKVIAINRALVLSKLQRKLRGHAVWQVTDVEDRWYCPYCAQPTAVRLPQPRRHGVSEAAVNAAWGHLASCPAYAGERARLKPLVELRDVASVANRQIRLGRQVRNGLATDERWSIHDGVGSWLCPFCMRLQKSISVPDKRPMVEKTIHQVVAHLSEQCPRYRDGGSVEATREELLSAAHRGEERVKAPVNALSEWGRRIDAEVEALKSQVAMSIELENSLEKARLRQMQLLPPVPQVAGLEVGVTYRPCSTVGGDFYDFVQVSDDELGVVIGDVSGHGIEAALLVGLAKKIIEVYSRGRSSPGETLVLANADLFPDLDAQTFVTAFYGVLNQRTKRFRFARAGHSPLIVFNRERTPPLQVIDAKGMALGMDAGTIFHQSLEVVEIQLRAGDLLLQYTDGVVESMNHDHEEFGLERLYGVVEAFGDQEAEYLLYCIERAVDDFREGARQRDDVTMIAMKVTA